MNLGKPELLKKTFLHLSISKGKIVILSAKGTSASTDPRGGWSRWWGSEHGTLARQHPSHRILRSTVKEVALSCPNLHTAPPAPCGTFCWSLVFSRTKRQGTETKSNTISQYLTTLYIWIHFFFIFQHLQPLMECLLLQASLHLLS